MEDAIYSEYLAAATMADDAPDACSPRWLPVASAIFALLFGVACARYAAWRERYARVAVADATELFAAPTTSGDDRVDQASSADGADTIELKTLEILRQATKQPHLALHDQLQASSLDSLAMVASARRLSSEFKVRFSPLELLEHTTAAAVASHLYAETHGVDGADSASASAPKKLPLDGAAEAEEGSAAGALASALADLRAEHARVEQTVALAAMAQHEQPPESEKSEKSTQPSAATEVATCQSYALLGTGGHAREIIRAMRREGRCEITGAYDDNPSVHGTRIEGVLVLGGTDTIPSDPNIHCLICVGHNETRKVIAGKLARRGVHACPPYWPLNAVDVAESASVGAGTVVGAGAVIGPGAVIGRHCVIQPGALVAHDAVVGDYGFVGGRAMLAGFATVEEGAVIGMGAVVAPKLRVGASSTVMVNSAVISDIPDRVRCGGVPAAVLGPSERSRVA